MSAQGPALMRLPSRLDYEAAGLTRDHVLRMYRTMVLARRVDERQWILNRQGKQAFVIGCQGHEASGIGSASAFQPGLDIMLPYYRSLPAVLAFGTSARDVFLESFSRAEAPWSGGRQMPSHFGDARYRILTSGSPVATQIPQAAGAGLASKMRGDGAVTIAYFGDGAPWRRSTARPSPLPSARPARCSFSTRTIRREASARRSSLRSARSCSSTSTLR